MTTGPALLLVLAATAPATDPVGSPGLIGFLVTFALVLACIPLFRSMTSKVRGVQYRDHADDVAAKDSAPEDSAPEDSAPEDSAPEDSAGTGVAPRGGSASGDAPGRSASLPAADAG